ncbi:hypothetical protein, partial [Escherichia coli]|uniref:hypothetical protein n=1 Tax=Escherichia coli TaxID=562 RepID=UPI002FF2270B
ALTFQNHTNRPLTDFGGKTSIFSHPVYLFLREFSLQDSRGGSVSEFQVDSTNRITGGSQKDWNDWYNKQHSIKTTMVIPAFQTTSDAELVG